MRIALLGLQVHRLQGGVYIPPNTPTAWDPSGGHVVVRFLAFVAIQGAGLCLSNNFSQIVKARKASKGDAGAVCVRKQGTRGRSGMLERMSQGRARETKKSREQGKLDNESLRQGQGEAEANMLQCCTLVTERKALFMQVRLTPAKNESESLCCGVENPDKAYTIYTQSAVLKFIFSHVYSC